MTAKKTTLFIRFLKADLQILHIIHLNPITLTCFRYIVQTNPVLNLGNEDNLLLVTLTQVLKELDIQQLAKTERKEKYCAMPCHHGFHASLVHGCSIGTNDACCTVQYILRYTWIHLHLCKTFFPLLPQCTVYCTQYHTISRLSKIHELIYYHDIHTYLPISHGHCFKVALMKCLGKSLFDTSACSEIPSEK